MENLKIGVFMWYDSTISEYANINYIINKIYCDKNNYSIIKSDIRKCPERKPHWERIPLILEYLNKYDYLIWIDADAHFYTDSPPITNVINTYPDKLFIFSGDIDAPNNEITCEINSGFFIVKSSEDSKNILDKWLYDDELFTSPKKSEKIFGANKWNDQAVLRIMYNDNINNLKDNSNIIEYGILQHFFETDKLKKQEFNLQKTPFIFHLAGSDNKNRIISSTNYYSNILLNNYKSYINKNIQLSNIVIKDILINTVDNNKKMLVFGLGYDSELWYKITNKNTYFIENKKEYIDLNKNIDSNNIVYHKYDNIKVKTSLNLTEKQINNFEIPKKILDLAPFDIILIDGPNGFNDDCPGRLLPIYWSKKYLSKEGTIIYIDDVNRHLEKKCTNKYFIRNTKVYFSDRLGTIKITI